VLERLRAVALADDEDIDELLRSVPLPEGFMARLYRTPLADDAGMDAALRELPVPAGVLGRLNRIPRRTLGLRQLARWAVAASLWLAVGPGRRPGLCGRGGVVAIDGLRAVTAR